MPYAWTSDPPASQMQELHLWPYNALKPEGFAALVFVFFLFAMMPLIGVMGSVVFWGLLPFLLAAVAALYFALRQNRRDRQILEILRITPTEITLERHNPQGEMQSWQAPTYWARLSLHETGGPVPNYITLRGQGREVELGAFLSEDERTALYLELRSRLDRPAQPM